MIFDRINRIGTRCCTSVPTCANVEPCQNVGNEKSSQREHLLPSFPYFESDFFHGPRARPDWRPVASADAQHGVAPCEHHASEIARLLLFLVFQRPDSSEYRYVTDHKFAITVSPGLRTVFRVCQDKFRTDQPVKKSSIAHSRPF